MLSQSGAINLASADFLQQLDAIEPGVWGTPCSVILLDGRSCDICLAWENTRYGDKGRWLNPQAVAEVRPTASRLPARFARQIHEAGESGMGYHIYIVELLDGASFVHSAGNLVIDLLNLPPGYGPDDIMAVFPNAGRDRSKTEGCRHVDEFQLLEYARPFADLVPD